MASYDLQETERNSVATHLVENTDDTTIEGDTLATDNKTKNELDGVQHRNLTKEPKLTGNDVTDDDGFELSSDVTYASNCRIDLQLKSDKDMVELRDVQDKPTNQQIKTETPVKDIIVVECGEISTTVKPECSIQCDVSKSEPTASKRHNVFKSIIDRLAQKSGSRSEHQTKTLFSAGDPQCPGSKAFGPLQHLMAGPQNPSVLPHASNSPELPFTYSSSSLSSSVCSSSSSALNLSFLFRGFPGCEHSGTSLDSEQGISVALPSNVAHPAAEFYERLANCRMPDEKTDGLEKMRLHSNETDLMDDAEILRDKEEILNCIIQSDSTESLSGMSCDQPVVYVDLENEETAASQETNKLGAIKRKYYKSLDHLRKVRVISCTFEKELEKLRLKRQCLQRALRQLRFLYNVTRLRYAKGGTLNRQTISSLWNLAKFKELTKEKQEAEEVEGEQENGEWHGIDKRLETGSNQGSSPRSSPAHVSDRQESGKYEDDVMEFGCDDDVKLTSFPVNYSLREIGEETRGSQCNVSRVQGSTTGDLASVSRSMNPVETESMRYQFSRRHRLPLIADGTPAWRYMNSPPYSADDQLEDPRTVNVVKTINSFPAHVANYNRLDIRKRTGGYAPINCHLTHSVRNKLEENVGRTPAAAHEAKRDLTNFTYLYCTQKGI